VGEFQLILLSDRERPVRARPPGRFALIPFCRVMAQPNPKVEIANYAKTWLRPHEALAILNAAYKKIDTSKHLLIERLRSGAILAVAEASTWIGGEHPHRTGPIGITSDQWLYWRPQTGFWEAGDMQLHLGHYRGSIYSVEVRFNGVRFDPETVADLAALAANDADVEIKGTPEPDAKQSGPPVPEAHLEAWYELFQKVYGGTAKDTEAFAHQSALGMFPDKSVTRRRIRELRGEQKRGRKPSEPAK
jgi:hypothetical protein